MSAIVRLSLIGAILATGIFAAEENSHGGESTQMWKWVNFAILAGGIGFLAVKMGGPAFKSRGEAIRRELDEARKTKVESEARVAEIERKLGNLSGEIETFRKESREMVTRESDRLRRETAQMLERAQTQAQQEIESLAKSARNQIKAETARLALELAEKRIATGITAETQSKLVASLVDDLKKVSAR